MLPLTELLLLKMNHHTVFVVLGKWSHPLEPTKENPCSTLTIQLVHQIQSKFCPEVPKKENTISVY